MYDSPQQRFYGFSFNELVDGLSKLMVRGRTYTCIDQNLVNLLLKFLEDPNQEACLIECVSNAILNASFDKKVRTFLDTDRAIEIITSARTNSNSELVQKNCEAILWTLNRIPHRRKNLVHIQITDPSLSLAALSTISNGCQLQGHVMISYNRSVTAMCLKIRDRLKVREYRSTINRISIIVSAI